MQRRIFLKTSLASATLGVAVSAGLLSPRSVLAAWPKSAFDAKSVEDAVKGLGGGSTETSGDIQIKAPDIAENGAVVPVTVETSMPADSIAVMASSNGTPLAADFLLGEGADGFVSTRIKMGK
ncbi:MAG: thiosulfate oxidation carrier protein SoxY, partial [Chromatiales bacterium]|nr:thiosulfate oxidation carrier protein SoxY [Chromatiales bacterium]